MTEEEKNKHRIEEMLKDMSDETNDLSFVDRILDSNYKYNRVPTSRSSNKYFLAELRKKYKNLEFTAEKIFAEADQVCVQWRLDVVHPQHGKGHYRGINIMRLANGWLVENEQNELAKSHKFWKDGVRDPIEVGPSRRVPSFRQLMRVQRRAKAAAAKTSKGTKAAAAKTSKGAKAAPKTSKGARAVRASDRSVGNG